MIHLPGFLIVNWTMHWDLARASAIDFSDDLLLEILDRIGGCPLAMLEYHRVGGNDVPKSVFHELSLAHI